MSGLTCGPVERDGMLDTGLARPVGERCNAPEDKGCAGKRHAQTEDLHSTPCSRQPLGEALVLTGGCPKDGLGSISV